MSKISNKNKYLAFVILIGGKSARFGSDKGIFEFFDKPLISYQIEVLSKFNKAIFLIAHSQQQIDSYQKKIALSKDISFILDDTRKILDQELQTPMIGIYSAFKELDKFGYEKAFILSCDSPLIKPEVIDLLIKQSKGYDCCIPKWNNTFLEPLFAIYPIRKAFRLAEKNIIKRTYKLTNLLDKHWKINYISIENSIQSVDEKLLTFININGPIDIKKLMKLYKSK